MPPTHFEGGNVNMFQPYKVGQSGTDRPDAVLVTRLPASTSSTVQPATSVAKRWSIYAGLKVKLTSLVSFAPIVTFCSCVPAFSCHASMV